MLNNQNKEHLSTLFGVSLGLYKRTPPPHARFVGGGGVMVKPKRWDLVLNWSLLLALLAAFFSKCSMYVYHGCSVQMGCYL